MPKILDHVIDGIEEYDTPLPRWWLYLFYLTIVWSVAYWLLYPSWFGPGWLQWSQNTAYEQEVAAHAEANPKADSGAMLAALIGNPAEIAEGKQVFAQNCAACHGAEAKGGIGPDLTDATWLYGSDPEGIFKTVRDGTANGMPAWGPIIGEQKVGKAVAFIHSLSTP